PPALIAAIDSCRASGRPSDGSEKSSSRVRFDGDRAETTRGHTSREEQGGTPGELAFGHVHDRQDRGGSDLRPDTPGNGWQGNRHRAPLVPGDGQDDGAEA